MCVCVRVCVRVCACARACVRVDKPKQFMCVHLDFLVLNAFLSAISTNSAQTSAH